MHAKLKKKRLKKEIKINLFKKNIIMDY